MERRKFIQSTSLLSVPLLFNKLPVFAASQLENSSLSLLASAAAEAGKILVIIEMRGGNDGLNTVFPKDQWSKLVNARSNILLNENDVLPLQGNDATGLHPSMPEMQNLYNDGKMMIVQAVSYPNPSLSHFRATDIWFTGSASNVSLQTGWLGRSLDSIYPGFPANYPNPDMPDPIAIQIGSSLPFSLQGPVGNVGYCAKNPAEILNVINATSDPAPNSDYGKEITFLRLMKSQSNLYRTSIQNAYNTPKPLSAEYPGDNRLADSFKVVAKLINGGLKTPVYIVTHPESFDSHDGQVNSLDKKTGKHPNNLATLSKAIGAFQEDLRLMGKEELVTGMTFSEFGRRIASNGSLGTDHGTTAPVMFFGAALNTGAQNVAGTAHPVSGMIGTHPVLPEGAGGGDFMPMQFDYRQLYSTVMQDWLKMSEQQANAVLGGTFEKLPIFKLGAGSFNKSTDFAVDDFISVYPNPVTNNQINIQFKKFVTSKVNVAIISIQGNKIFEDVFVVDSTSLSFDVNKNVPLGNHILELTCDGNKYYKKLIFK